MITSSHLSQATLDLLGEHATHVDGSWAASASSTLDVVDPSTGSTVGSVGASDVTDVERAVAAARRAFDESGWASTPHTERARLLRRLADIIERHAASFAELGTLEVGTPISLSRGLHAAAPVSFFRFWADAAVRGPYGGYEEGLPLIHQPVTAASTLYREPIGVVAAISAYNYPLLITSFKVGGALAAGCTAVLMPSPRTPLSAIAFLRCVQEAGFPPGVVNLVTGDARVGEALTLAEGVDLVSFTGSVEVGRKVMEQAARGLKHVVLELGGKSPNIVLPGADVAATVGPSILRFTRNAGQGCGATTRTLVPRASYEEYAAQAKSVMETLVVGDPWDERTDVGPVIRGDHRARIEGFVQRALDGGAVVLAGGGRPELADGYYLNPALIGGVAGDAEICQEELFGPIGTLIPYDTVDDAVAIANGTRYGLNSNVWGPTPDALAFARRLKAGTVTVNGGGADRPDAPWPSQGHSGVGVDRGYEGFREFFRVRHVQYPVR